MSLSQITPLVITYNEAPNIGRVLDRLTWARRIVVIDSGSDDATLEIVRRFPQAVIFHRTFDSFARQCNFGLSHISTPWTLSLDADYVLSDKLVDEMGNLDLSSDVAGYTARFVYKIGGRTLRGSLYPPRTVLYRTACAQYHDEGHGHRVGLAGPARKLSAPIYHDDRKPLVRWFASQQSYARKEADFLRSAPRADLRPQDQLRLMLWPAPIAALLFTLFVKGCIFDGLSGWHYAMQRLFAECILSLELLDRRLDDERRS
jgi:glycosyltransferase involved in cell wall biosynthesis